MKKTLLIFVTFIVLFTSTINVFAFGENLNLSSEAYVLLDANSGKVLLGRNEKVPMYPASTTKIMTAIIGIEEGNFYTPYLASKSAIGNIGIGGSTSGIRVGEKVYLNDLLYMLLLCSGNDAGNVIAENISGNTFDFARKMNAKASSIGTENTYFLNPIGLDVEDGFPQHKTSARDLALMMRYATSLDKFREIVGTEKYSLPKTNIHSEMRYINSTNKFLSKIEYDKSLYTVIGAKTGYTKAAKNSLVVAAKNNQGHELICVLMKSKSRDCVFNDAKTLFDHGFAAIRDNSINVEKGFYDIRFNWAKASITDLFGSGYIAYSGNGSFKPDEAATKQELFSILTKMSKSLPPKVSDENAPNADKAIETSSEQAIDNLPLLRKDIIGILAKEFESEPAEEDIDNISAKFKDSNLLDMELKKNICTLYKHNIITGYSDGTIQIDKQITKAEMVFILERFKNCKINEIKE